MLEKRRAKRYRRGCLKCELIEINLEALHKAKSKPEVKFLLVLISKKNQNTVEFPKKSRVYFQLASQIYLFKILQITVVKEQN